MPGGTGGKLFRVDTSEIPHIFPAYTIRLVERCLGGSDHLARCSGAAMCLRAVSQNDPRARPRRVPNDDTPAIIERGNAAASNDRLKKLPSVSLPEVPKRPPFIELEGDPCCGLHRFVAWLDAVSGEGRADLLRRGTPFDHELVEWRLRPRLPGVLSRLATPEFRHEFRLVGSYDGEILRSQDTLGAFVFEELAIGP